MQPRAAYSSQLGMHKDDLGTRGRKKASSTHSPNPIPPFEQPVTRTTLGWVDMIAASRTAQLPVGDERLSSFDLHTFSEPRSLQRTEAFGRLTMFAGAEMEGLAFCNVRLASAK